MYTVPNIIEQIHPKYPETQPLLPTSLTSTCTDKPSVCVRFWSRKAPGEQVEIQASEAKWGECFKSFVLWVKETKTAKLQKGHSHTILGPHDILLGNTWEYGTKMADAPIPGEVEETA